MFKNKLAKVFISTAMAVVLATTPVSSTNWNMTAITAMADSNGFVVEEGILTSYQGNGGLVTIPNTVTQIGPGAFSGCTQITGITIPGSVTVIDERAFYGCSGLQSIELLEGIKSIGKWAFYGCSSLESIALPDGVESIGELAFYNCSSMTTIQIPLSVTMIASSAISGNTSEDLVIIGQENSYAESYANENNIEFVIVDDFEEMEGEKEGVTLPSGATTPITGKCKILSLVQMSKKSARVFYQKYKGAEGYEIHYATNKKFKNKKVYRTSNLYCSLRGLEKGKNYYVKVRAYKSNKTYLGKFSSVKSVKLSDNQSIIYKKDVFSFQNPKIDHKLNRKSPYYKALIKKTAPSYVSEIEKNMEIKSGICFGMACVMALSKAGKITPSFYNKSNLYELPVPAKRSSVSYKLLNYYFLSQMVGGCLAARSNYSKENEALNNKMIVEAMKKSDYPVVIGFNIYSNHIRTGGHAVVGYDLKTEKNGYSITIWDPNYTSHSVELFISGDYKESYFRNNYYLESGGKSTYLKYALTVETSPGTYDEVNIQKYIEDMKQTSGGAIYALGLKKMESAVTNVVQSKVILNTNYLDFKIFTSAGSYAIVEGGDKIEGDLEIESPDLVNGPEEEINAYYNLPVLKIGETYTVIPKESQLSVVTGQPLMKYDTVLMYHEKDGYYARVSAEKPVTLTVNTSGDITTKTEDGEKLKQTITTCVNDGRISWIATDIEGTDSEFFVVNTEGKTEISSKNESVIKIGVDDEMQELTLGETVVSQGGITVQADGEDYVAKDPEGTEVLRKAMGYSVDFDTMNEYIEVDTLYNVEKDSLISEPEKIEREGYIFDGWYKDIEFNEKWDFANDRVVDHTTLYAKWTKEDNGQNGTVKVLKTKKVTLKNSAKKKIKVTWKKISKVNGYEVAYSTNKKFSKSETKIVKVGKTKKSVTIKKLKKGKTYYVKVRAYKKAGTKTVYGKYSTVKKIKIKK